MSSIDGSSVDVASNAPVNGVQQPAGGPRGILKLRLVVAFQRRRRLWIGLCVALVTLVALRAMTSGASAATLELALAEVAASDGIRVDPDTVVWLEEDDGPLFLRGALFLGHREGELNDLYYADVRPAGDGTALDVACMTNLSRTASADEEQILHRGDHLAYATLVGDRYDAVVVMDLRGEPDALTADWPARARLQDQVSNIQDYGRAAGFGIRRYHILEGGNALTLAERDGHFVVQIDDDIVELDPLEEAPVEGGRLVEMQEQSKGMPETVPWIVDTVRSISWVGPEPIEWLENRVFAVKDFVLRAYHGVVGQPDTAREVAEELAMPEQVSEERIAMLTVTDPELGWPPQPLEPVIDDSVQGEGGWIPVVDDPFVNAYPNAPPAFYQTFLRSDPERPYTHVYITVWDPRQVQLRIQSGVREPESATGQRGSGLVPREERVLRHLVAAFNGGFQSLHGEFGMMADRRVYLPPKPWSATVAVYDDGRVGMGSWPAPDWNGRFYDERLANQQIPEDMVDLRQNLTSVVEDGVYNPWERWYWGAAPREAGEQTYTTRSAMCLTEEGFLAYYWSQGIGPEALGVAMIQTRCVRSVHLDMNNPHCGFEFFRPFEPGVTPPPLTGRRHRDSEYDGRFMRAPRGWRLRARRGVRTMGMPFPRYSDRDGRDFFYLTLRPLLPGPDVGATTFSTEGLPHAGWPHAFARARFGNDDAHTWVVRIDPRRAVAEPMRRLDHERALAHLVGSGAGGEVRYAIYARRRTVGWEVRAGLPSGEDDVVLVAGPQLTEASDTDAAIGVDRDGFLVYLERRGDPASLASVAQSLGLVGAVAMPTEARLAFQVGPETVGVDGFARDHVEPHLALSFFAEERAASEVMFPNNEPQPYRVWSTLQDQRVRYFPNREGDERPRFIRPQNERDDDEE